MQSCSQCTRRRRPRWRASINPLPALAAALLAGCASSSSPTAEVPESLADRADAPVEPARVESPAASNATGQVMPESTVADASGDPVIGHIEDGPIHASEVLDGLDAQLTELGLTLPRYQFRDRARRLVERQLQEMLVNRLILFDAERALNENQQEAMSDFEARMRTSLIEREGEGDPAAADRKLRAADGRGLDEHVGEFTRRGLLEWRMQNVIDERIEVTDEMVQAEYDRRQDEYHTPGQQTIRLIRTTDADAADRIDAALAAGTPYQDVAAGRDNAGGGDGVRNVAAGDLVAPLETAVAGLAPGERTSRIRVGASICWVELVSRTPARTVALADVRPTLERALRSELRTELQNRYVRDLLESSTYTPPRQMALAAVAIAMDRYADSGT
jgi:parvulin-like peptidyl-prolyl isomerase